MGRLKRWPISDKRQRGWLLPAVLLLSLLLVAGCSRQQDEGLGLQAAPLPTNFNAAGVTSEAPVASDTTPIAIASQSALARIRQRDEMRVGILYNYPPFGQLTEQGTIEGFEVDLVRAMAEKWGVAVTFMQVTRQTGIPYLLDDEIDLVAAAVPHRRELHATIDFSQTTFRSGYLALVSDSGDGAIESYSDLDGRSVAIVEQPALDIVRNHSESTGVTVTTQTYSTIIDAVQAMLDGEVAAVVGRREELMLAAQTNANVSILSKFLAVEPYSFAMRRSDADFRNLIDVTLQNLAAEGTYAELFQAHFYNYPADLVPDWAGAVSPEIGSLPDAIRVPEIPIVERLQRGEAITVAGLQLEYDDPELDGQRLLDDFNRALINEMARRWGVSVNEVPGSAGDDGSALLAAGRADMVVGIQPDAKLSGGIDYSQSYLERGLRLVHLSDVDLEGIDDLNSPRSAAVVNSVQGASLIRDENVESEVIETDSAQQALDLLQSRSAWAVLADEFTAGLMTRQGPNIVLMDAVFLPTTYAVGVPRYDSDFRALVNFTLQEMYTDGTLDTLTEQYFGSYFSQDDRIRPLALEIWPGDAAYLGIATSR